MKKPFAEALDDLISAHREFGAPEEEIRQALATRAELPVGFDIVAHQALDDAVAQAYHLQSIVKVRGIVV